MNESREGIQFVAHRTMYLNNVCQWEFILLESSNRYKTLRSRDAYTSIRICPKSRLLCCSKETEVIPLVEADRIVQNYTSRCSLQLEQTNSVINSLQSQYPWMRLLLADRTNQYESNVTRKLSYTTVKFYSDAL